MFLYKELVPSTSMINSGSVDTRDPRASCGSVADPLSEACATGLPASDLAMPVRGPTPVAWTEGGDRRRWTIGLGWTSDIKNQAMGRPAQGRSGVKELESMRARNGGSDLFQFEG